MRLLEGRGPKLCLETNLSIGCVAGRGPPIVAVAFGRSGNCSEWPGDLVSGPWGSILARGGFFGEGPVEAPNIYDNIYMAVSSLPEALLF